MDLTFDSRELYFDLPACKISLHMRQYDVQKRIVGSPLASYIETLYSRKMNQRAMAGDEEALKKLEYASRACCVEHFCKRRPEHVRPKDETPAAAVHKDETIGRLIPELRRTIDETHHVSTEPVAENTFVTVTSSSSGTTSSEPYTLNRVSSSGIGGRQFGRQSQMRSDICMDSMHRLHGVVLDFSKY